MGKGKRLRTIRQESARATVGRSAADTKSLARAVRKDLKKR